MNKRNFLLVNGFVEGVDFEYSLKEEESGENYNVSSWGEKALWVTFKINRVRGNCMLIYFSYDKTSDTIIQSRANFDMYEGKVECYPLMGNGRKITSKTLKEKIVYKNSAAEWEMVSTRNTKAVLKYTIEKYQKLAPKSKVTVTREERYGHYFDAVNVKYENGNLLIVQPGRKNDEESVHRFIDVTTTSKSAEELAQYLGQ